MPVSIAARLGEVTRATSRAATEAVFAQRPEEEARAIDAWLSSLAPRRDSPRGSAGREQQHASESQGQQSRNRTVKSFHRLES